MLMIADPRAYGLIEDISWQVLGKVLRQVLTERRIDQCEDYNGYCCFCQ